MEANYQQMTTDTTINTPQVPMHQKCDGAYCDEHKMAMQQLGTLAGLPLVVSKLTGIVSLIAVTFIGIAGIMLTFYFEDKATTKMYNAKLDAISVKITESEKEDKASEARINERLIRIETTLEAVEKRIQ